jgi:hypothetical protein
VKSYSSKARAEEDSDGGGEFVAVSVDWSLCVERMAPAKFLQHFSESIFAQLLLCSSGHHVYLAGSEA